MQVAAASPHSVQERASACVSFLHVVTAGISFEEAISKAYWRNAWKMLETKPLSTIDLIADDGAWEAKVRVLSATEGNVRFRVLWAWKPEMPAVKRIPEGARIEHITGRGWRCIDASNAIVIENEPSEAELLTELAARMPAPLPAAKVKPNA